METNNILQVFRQATINGRLKRAWWDCKIDEYGAWRIHFHADCVPSQDHVFVGGIDDLFKAIQSMHDIWIETLQNMA